ncbi:MAG: sodium-translocating pyrophosphatase [Anaerolineales bacterium]
MYGLDTFEQIAIWTVLGAAILGLLYAVFLRYQVLKEDKGTPEMQKVWNAIRSGANAYLRRQLVTILPLILILTFALFASIYIVPPSSEASVWYCMAFKQVPAKAAELCVENLTAPENQQIRTLIGIGRAIAFMLGAGFSLMVGQIGMRMAVQGNVRVASAARFSFGDSLRIAYRSGTITGMLTDGLGLLGGTVIFMIFGVAAPDALLGFGFGATLIALFMRVGGGIFTKAADVGADLVGKVEAGLVEDDPRNPAVIADLVGDNVGDCAGMAADIFESYEVTIVSSLILGVALFSLTGHIEWIIFPLLVRGVGVFASIIGTYNVRGSKGMSGDAMRAIFTGFLTSAAISVVLFGIIAAFYMKGVPGGWWRPFLATTAGVLLAIVIDRVTDYFTGSHGKPVKDIKDSADTGPATLILSGISSGFESSAWSALILAGTIFASVLIFGGISSDPRLDFTYILYGVALTGIGMLTLTGNNVAMDSFGPIADNANGIGEMAWHDKDDEQTRNAKQIMADLDAVGNTTKAITKGIAIGSAVIAAVSLFGSFITDVSRVDPTALANGIRLSIPGVFVGLLIGGAIPWLFSSFAIMAVSRAASLIIREVRRQFKLGVLEGAIEPDYSRPIEVATTAAQKELIPLALIGVLSPIVVGLVFQVEAVGGFLAGIIISGQLLAVFLNNSGGAWDNAKKLIEDEPSEPENNLGKGSERHMAGVVGDTVGDPFKDTAGPALNPMIKVVNLVALIVAPIVVVYKSLGFTGWLVVVLAVVALIWAIYQSKKPAKSLVDIEPTPSSGD